MSGNDLCVKLGASHTAKFLPYHNPTKDNPEPRMMTAEEVLEAFPSMPKKSLRTYYIHRLAGGAFYVSQRMDLDCLVGRTRAHTKGEAEDNAREAGYAVE